MNLVTPDSGLLFWMVLIFAILLFLLWRFGFPVITDMVDRRSDRIDEALRKAEEAERRMRDLASEQEALLERTRLEQDEIIREAAREKAQIISDAQTAASAEADKIIAQARKTIEAEKESAMQELRSTVAELSVAVSEKILRQALSGEEAQREYIGRLLDGLPQQSDSKEVKK